MEELQELLKSNDTYPDTPEGRDAMAREERDRTAISASMTFDHSAYGSSDDAERRRTVARNRFRLVPLFQTNRPQFEREYAFLQEQLPLLQTSIDRKRAEVAAIDYRQKPLSHRVYTFFTRSPTSHNFGIRAHRILSEEIGNLNSMLHDCTQQLNVYRTIRDTPPVATHVGPVNEDPQPVQTRRNRRRMQRRQIRQRTQRNRKRSRRS